ncbi:unnamed protein product, partial [Ectocarpus sp. 6 AP-2014]
EVGLVVPAQRALGVPKGAMMHNAIAKCGVLKKKSGMLRRKESRRFYVLTNTGGIFFAKGFAAEFDSLKPLLTLTGSSEVSLERGGSADSGYVMRITTRGNKPPPQELEASSEPETVAWSQVVHDVIELVGTINGDQYAAQPRPLGGLRVGDEGWYLEPTGRMALYTLNSHRRWAVQDRREYDEPTVLNWIAGDRMSRTSSSGSNSARLGYPSQSGAAVAGSSADQQSSGSPDYPVNSGRGSPDPAPPAHPADYPSQHSHSQQSMRSTSATMSHLGGGGGGGGGGGTWATHAPPAGPNSSFAHGGGGGSRSPEAGGTVVGGVLVRGGRGGGGDGGGGGGGSADAILVGPLPVLPSVFVVGKGEGNSFGDEADSLVLRRPSTSCSANGGGGGGGSADGGRGRREEQAGEEVLAVTANNNSHGRLGRVGRWRGGGRGAGAAAAAPERRPSGGDSGRRPLELSPGMEVLQSWLQRS